MAHVPSRKYAANAAGVSHTVPAFTLAYPRLRGTVPARRFPADASDPNTHRTGVPGNAIPERPAPRARAGGGTLGALGITGGLICTATMVLPALGAAGAAAGGMQGMTSGDEPPHDGLLGILTDAGPAILIVSTLLVTLGVGLRRPLATVPALAAGAVLYWGMYAQPSYPVMYLTLVLGFTGWLATYLWARQARPAPTRPTPPAGRINVARQ